jgi:hypothetical protein
MHFQQVALALLAFSSTRGASVQSSLQRLTVVPALGTPRIVVEQDIRDPSAWQVRVVARLEPPIYLPPVTTQQGLQDALERAWQFRHPLLTRFLEPPVSAPLRSSPPTSWPSSPASSPPRSASHPRPQTDSA